MTLNILLLVSSTNYRLDMLLVKKKPAYEVAFLCLLLIVFVTLQHVL